MKDWKSVLLDTGSFIDNEYLDCYIELVNASHDNLSYMEKHHVIPVAYYKHKYNIDTRKHRHEAERKADADAQNALILLSFANHCKAHWLLTKCTIGRLAVANSYAFIKQVSALKPLNEKIILNYKDGIIDVGITDREFEQLQQYINELRTDSTVYWTAEQDEWLKQYRPKHTAKYCADYLGKTESAILTRCTQLGIKREWQSEEENAKLLEYSKTHTAQECAAYFGVSKHLIVKRWRELGFSKTFRWTDEMDTWLRENDSKYTVEELADHLGTTKTVVMGRRWKLGITRWERTK